MVRTKDFDPDQVLERAAQCFKRHGYHGVSLDTLTDEMGIGRGSLYATYGDKHTLFLSALATFARGTVGTITGRLDGATDPVAEIRALLHDAARLALRPEGEHGCLLVNSAAELGKRDTEVQQFLATCFEQIENAFCRALRRAQRDGQLAPDKKPRALARLLLSTLQGIRVLGKARPDPRVLHDVAESALLCLE
jgi:TetR/AcrR family transcriptional repressor of nem operon